MGRRRRRRNTRSKAKARTSKPRRNTRSTTGRTSRSKQRTTGAGTRSSKAKSSGKSQGGARSGAKSGATKKAKRAVRRVTRSVGKVAKKVKRTVGKVAKKVKKTLKTKSPRGVRTNRMKNRLKNRPVRTKDTKIAQTRFKSVPAGGPAGDNMSTKAYREGMLPGLRDVVPGESLQKTIKRLSNQDMLAANNIKNLGITPKEGTYFSRKDTSSYGYPSATPKTTTPKSNMDKIRDAARARHENFKKTGVQTFGGTRRNYSTREAEKIRDAGLNFSKVTGGAKNPLARAPINPNIKVGELMPGVEGFGMANIDKFMSPNVNYDFSKRDTSLPSMSTLAKADLSGFSKSLGINRDNFGGGKNAFSGSPSDLGYTMRDMFQAKDLGNMTTNALTKYVPGLTIRPQSMADRDQQTFLGFNPNRPSRNLKATDPGRPKSQQQGTNSYLAPVNATATTAPVDEDVIESEVEDPIQEDQQLPDLGDISEDEYETVINELTGGNNTGTDSSTPNVAAIAQTTGVDPGIIERILAGYRGKKRIKFGSGKNESLKLRRGDVGFTSRIPNFILSSLNV